MKNLFVIACISLLQTATIYAQEGYSSPEFYADKKIVDNALAEFVYELKWAADTANMQSRMRGDTLVLQRGGELSRFYSAKTARIDSVLAGLTMQDFVAEIRQGRGSGGGPSSLFRGMRYSIYKNYPKNRMTVIDALGYDYYQYEEKLSPQQWTISDETREILGYECQKAECDFRGRHYTAWFAPDIPVNDGPWKFHGLPGLIMEVADGEGHYSFTIIGMRTTEEKPILYPKLLYNKTTRTKFLQTAFRYEVDFTGYHAGDVPFKEFLRSSGPDDYIMKYDFMETDYR